MIQDSKKKILLIQIYKQKASLTPLNFIIQATPNVFLKKNKIYALFVYFLCPAKKKGLNAAIIFSVTSAKFYGVEEKRLVVYAEKLSEINYIIRYILFSILYL